MSRLLKLIVCVAALSAAGAAALAAAAPASAPARGVSHVIICPLEPAGTAPPCCGPPIATAGSATPVCCGTPEPVTCPLGLTLSSSADPSVAGQKLTLSGHWPGGTAGQTVDLWQELPGAKTFKHVASTTTDSLGDFKFVRKGVETNRKWYVKAGGEQSATVDQQVVAIVTVEYGGANHYRGRVTPDHAGEHVWVERKSHGNWAVIARVRLSGKSTYAFTRNLCNTTSRVVFPGDRRNVRSPSETMKSSCASGGRK
jgi:hypothetical protein